MAQATAKTGGRGDAASSRERMRFRIYRYGPDQGVRPRMQELTLQLDGERMLLDALNALKAQDPSLAYRRSCREGVCGADAMNINGKNGLACLTTSTTKCRRNVSACNRRKSATS